MYKTIKISFASVLAVSVALFAVLAYQALTATRAVAQDAASDGQDAPAEQADYTYTAQQGDTYTQIARKAIQTYGIDNNVNISPAGIVFAETNLAKEANGGELNEGQEVKVDGDLVKKWADAAGKLSENEQKAWDVYVPFVNFNTDSVGQSS